MFKETNGSKFLDEKKKLVISSIIKKSLDSSHSKKIKSKITNLKFANIIINMNQNLINTNFNIIKEQNTKRLFNIQSNGKNVLSEKENFSPKVLSILIQGIISLKTNDIIGYIINLCEIILYIKNNNTNPNFNMYESLYVNNEFLYMVYQTYFKLFYRDANMYKILKHDFNKNQEIFKKTHLIYIFYIFTGINYLYTNYNNLNNKNSLILNFLKNLLENEKCKKCFLCEEIRKINNIQNKKIFQKKTRVFCVRKNESFFRRNDISNLDKIYFKNFSETERQDSINNDSNLFSMSQKINIKNNIQNKNTDNSELSNNTIYNTQLTNSYIDNNKYFNYPSYFSSYEKLPNKNNNFVKIDINKSDSSKKIMKESNFKIYTENNKKMTKYVNSNINNNNISTDGKKSSSILKRIFPKKLDLKNKSNDNNSLLSHSSKQLIKFYNENSNLTKLKNTQNNKSSKLLKINYKITTTKKNHIKENKDSKKIDNNSEIVENCTNIFFPSIKDKINEMENKLKDFQMHNDKIKKQLFALTSFSDI